MTYRPLARLDDLVMQEVEDELVVYDPCTQQAHCLNAVAPLVLRLCDGTRTVSEIASHLSRERDLPEDESLVWEALDALSKAGLLTQPAEPPEKPDILRRAIIAAGMCLPIVETMLVPMPAAAISGIASTNVICVNGSRCSTAKPAAAGQEEIGNPAALFGAPVQEETGNLPTHPGGQ